MHLAECGQEGFQVLVTNARRQVSLLLPSAVCCGQERQECSHTSPATCLVRAGFPGRLQRCLHRCLLCSRFLFLDFVTRPAKRRSPRLPCAVLGKRSRAWIGQQLLARAVFAPNELSAVQQRLAASLRSRTAGCCERHPPTPRHHTLKESPRQPQTLSRSLRPACLQRRACPPPQDLHVSRHANVATNTYKQTYNSILSQKE